MNTQISKVTVFLLFCLFTGKAMTTPARDYTMVNTDNGLTSTILDIGTTSFTFRVEWSGKLEIPGDKWLFLMGRRRVDSVWNFMTGIEVDPAQGKATIELPYNWLPEEYYDFGKAFKGKAFFHVSAPPADDTGWLGPRPEEEEPQNKVETEQGGTDGAEKSNRLWLYVGIILVIGAGFYFLRKRFARN